MAWLGLVSYGIYLWHLRLLELLPSWGLNSKNSAWGMLLLGARGLVLTVLLAATSYYVVERPILRFKYRRAAPPRRANEDSSSTISNGIRLLSRRSSSPGASNEP